MSLSTALEEHEISPLPHYNGKLFVPTLQARHECAMDFKNIRKATYLDWYGPRIICDPIKRLTEVI